MAHPLKKTSKLAFFLSDAYIIPEKYPRPDGRGCTSY